MSEIYHIEKSEHEIKMLLKVRKFKAGYELRKELILMEGNPPITMTSAYTLFGNKYIGNSKDAYRLCVKYGIAPELSKDSNNVCSIGYSMKYEMWFGWSHKAISGFAVGDTVKEGDCTASSGYTDEYLKENPADNKALPIGFVAKTMDDAKLMAIAFADSVS